MALELSVRKGFREHLLEGMDYKDDKYEEFIDIVEHARKYGHYFIFDLPDDLVLRARKVYIPEFMEYWQIKYPTKNALKKTAYRIMDEMKEYIEYELM